MTALFLVFLLPAVPFYCGWQVLKAEPAANEPQLKVSASKPWVSPLHEVIGGLAVLVGLYYGIQFAVILGEQIVSPIFGWSYFDTHWFWTLLALAVAAFPIAAMAWGVIFCGVTVSNATIARSGLFHAEGFHHGLLSVSALVAGIVLFFALAEVLVPLL